MLWVAAITYLRTGEGWLYLAAVQDAYPRLIVGWSMATLLVIVRYLRYLAALAGWLGVRNRLAGAEWYG